MREKFTPPEAMEAHKENKKPHLTQFEGKEYDVEKLEAFAEDIPTTHFSLENPKALEDIVESKYWETKDGESIGPGDLLRAFNENNNNWDQVKEQHPGWSVHIEKVKGVDYHNPGLVYEGYLIDGIHRFTKALSEGAEELPIKVLPELPADAEHVS